MRLKNKRSLITGASRGIGRATAVKLASEGASVVVNYLEQQELAEEVVREIRAQGGDAWAAGADVTNRKDVDQMFAKINERYGRLDILVNNAGLGMRAPIEQIDGQTMEKLFAINTLGALYCAQAAARLMQGSGVIINVSTLAVKKSLPGIGAYRAAKAALDALTRQLAFELAPKNIVVNGVAPGAVETDREHLLPPEVKKRIVESTPAGRVAQPADIANVIFLLCLEESFWIRGQIINADGACL
jgi:NAD(P)-dependent dehydrogenase (short-subunit alcohol dehydrogenase family)